MNNIERAIVLLCVIVFAVISCALALTVIAPEAYHAPQVTPTARLIDAYQFLPYHAYEDRATPTRICLPRGCAPTPRATATRYTGTRAPTWTPYP